MVRRKKAAGEAAGAGEAQRATKRAAPEEAGIDGEEEKAEEHVELDADGDGEAAATGEASARRRKKKRRAEKSGEPAAAPAPTSKPASKAAASASTPAPAPPTAGQTIFVSGIPYEATEDDLRKVFAGIGKITSVRMPRYHDSGKLRGYALLDFSTPAQAAAACKRSGVMLQGRYLDVTVSTGRDAGRAPPPLKQPSGEVSATLFVKNVPYDMEDQELETLLAPFGTVLAVRVGIDSGTGRTKGFAYVEFSKEAEAARAVNASFTDDGLSMRGRRLALDYDTGRARASYKGRRIDG